MKMKWAVIRREQLNFKFQRWEFDTEEEAESFADNLVEKYGGWMYTDVMPYLYGNDYYAHDYYAHDYEEYELPF